MSYLIAYYVTPHGLGHATRALEIVRQLLSEGDDCSVTLVSGPAVGTFFQAQLSATFSKRFFFRKSILDSGALQPHAFTVDMPRSLQTYFELADGDQRAERIEVRACQ
jgi:L-arabinokinase